MIRSKKVVVVAVSLLLLGGCGSSPTEADARRCLGARIAKVSEGRIKLVSLRKTNGREVRRNENKAAERVATGGENAAGVRIRSVERDGPLR